MNGLERLAAVIMGFVGLLATRALSLVPYGDRPPHALLRLSWSARPERLEVCRTLSDAELAERPAHMRLRTECSGRFASYLLIARVGDSLVLKDTVRGGGFRNDRPIHFVRDVQVSPGRHTIHVSLARIDSTTATSADSSVGPAGALGDRAQREADERRRRAAEALLAYLVLDQETLFAAGRVVMVTYANEQRRLVLLNGSAP